MLDPISTLFQLGLGQWLTPLQGKRPHLDAWQKQPPTDEDQVREWWDSGFSLGFRTGSLSGLIVIDDDRAKHRLDPYPAPPTGLVSESPTGSRHYYYRAPVSGPCPGNSASKLAPKVDVRGEGGQVVVPPSSHPTAHGAYRWVRTGAPGTLPAELLALLVPQLVRIPDGPASTPAKGYGPKALANEANRVRSAPEGSRNDTLNRAAFSLGQLVAGGVLDRGRVEDELMQAAQTAGLPEREASTTIRSGLTAGAASPRSAPTATAPQSPPPRTSTAPREVMVPGAHTRATGEYLEQGTHAFADGVLRALPPGALYRRGGVVGEIHAEDWVPVPVNRARSVVDSHARLVHHTIGRDGVPADRYIPCSRDLAAVLLEYAAVLGPIRELRHLAAHPVCIGEDFRLARPGWNDTGGVYLAAKDVPEPLPIDEARAVLEDLVCDFPFQAPADRANFFGLLLTPFLRPAIPEPVPMHLIGSPMERTGKTKLAEIVLGITIMGRRAPAMQLGEREEEREKRILAVLMRGQGILHLDNLGQFLDSPALASLLTSSEYQGRILGASAAPSLPNGLTVVGTGNNVHATGEIAKRIVPIRLMPSSETPEDRTDFKHPDLSRHVQSERQRILSALVGLVEHWRASGRPLHSVGFGGFERWAQVVGGILGAAGWPEWLTNLREWRGVADDTGEEARTLIAAWHAKWACEAVQAAQLYDLAAELELYGWIESAGKTDRARRTSFGMRVLNRLVSRVYHLPDNAGEVRIASQGTGSKRLLRLERT